MMTAQTLSHAARSFRMRCARRLPSCVGSALRARHQESDQAHAAVHMAPAHAALSHAAGASCWAGEQESPGMQHVAHEQRSPVLVRHATGTL